MKMFNFERKYSPGYRHMICIGKTKSTSEKGLLETGKDEVNNKDNTTNLKFIGRVREKVRAARAARTLEFRAVFCKTTTSNYHTCGFDDNLRIQP